jgi:hypothetical protein
MHADEACEAELLNRDGWAQVGPRSGSEEDQYPAVEETYILYRTARRKEKEKAIRGRFSSSMERALQGPEKTILAGATERPQ